jgi:hypothetical protein
MRTHFIAKSLITAVTIGAALAGSQAFAADHSQPRGEAYGYQYRTGERNAFVDGARVGKADPFTDGARSVISVNGESKLAQAGRTVDPRTDGARTGKFDVFTDGANA